MLKKGGGQHLKKKKEKGGVIIGSCPHIPVIGHRLILFYHGFKLKAFERPHIRIDIKSYPNRINYKYCRNYIYISY